VSQRYQEFEALISRVQSCRSCVRMCESVRVLSWANGDPHAPLMFLGEAPGRLGADRTAVPFHGDKSGDNFERLLDLAGLKRSQIFVTNAVLCNPRDERGNNAPPTLTEIDNCAQHLKSQIDLIQPQMVMTLGGVSLEATRRIEPHDYSLRASVRTANSWYGRLLLPLYHPGARAMIHRSFANQTADYYFVGETFRRLTRPSNNFSRTVRGSKAEWDTVRYLIESLGVVTNFRLHKIMYLIDLAAYKAMGTRATNFLYLRQKDGPYCVELGSKWYQRFEGNLAIRKTGGALTFEWRSTGLFARSDENLAIDHQITALVDEVVDSTTPLSDAQLKTRAYLTEPMRLVLKAEKAGHPMLNKPLWS